ncbi:hypothetical protein AGMMS4956_20890 [Bacteroidia bacterium]|nr:hypothetical protein AGMMS4956_20890 [Bacteroidia bacterium]
MKFLLIACFSLLTLYVAGSQLKKQSDMACINTLTKLRELLSSDRNRRVHFALFPPNERKTLADTNIRVKEKEFDGLVDDKDISMVDVYNYLGTIGIGTQMIKKELIDMATFYDHIGYRVENLFEGKTDAHQIVQKHIFDNDTYYHNLLQLRDEIHKWKMKRLDSNPDCK